MTEANPLVADVTPLVKPEDGIAARDFFIDAQRAVDNQDWCEAGIDFGASALDVAMAVTDPFGTLLSSAFAWMMEHVSPLPEMLNALAGNPDIVQANAHTWANVSDALGRAAADMEQTVKADTAPWYGPAVDVYKLVGEGEAKLIDGASTAASAVGAAVSGAGIAVQTVRTVVRDLIASAMSDLVQWLGRSAIAAGVTLGLATPLLVADGIRIVAKWSTRVAEWLDKIVSSIKKLAEIVKKVKPALTKVQDALEPVQKAGKSVQAPAKKVGLDNMTTGQEAVFHTVRNSAAIGSTYDDQKYWQTTTGQQ